MAAARERRTEARARDLRALLEAAVHAGAQGAGADGYVAPHAQESRLRQPQGCHAYDGSGRWYAEAARGPARRSGSRRAGEADARDDVPRGRAPRVVRQFLGVATAALAISLAANAHAQAWKPQKPVEIVVPTAAGGANDNMARLIQTIMQSHKL